jgi:hypothetical protein
MMAIFELRQYQVKPNMMDAWLDLMENEIIPYVVSKGMMPIASFRGEQDKSIYFWIRRFENEEHREKLYASVYDADHWKNILSPKVGELINRDASIVQRVHPTSLSPIQ